MNRATVKRRVGDFAVPRINDQVECFVNGELRLVSSDSIVNIASEERDGLLVLVQALLEADGNMKLDITENWGMLKHGDIRQVPIRAGDGSYSVDRLPDILTVRVPVKGVLVGTPVS